jgi:heterodisulfide reductase subunit A
VEEGLNIATNSPRAVKARRMTMELLLARCPEVQALQHMARQLGVTEVKYPPGDSDCILCGLCVRVCHELQHVGAIGLMGRGANRRVSTPFGEFSENCRVCGACAFVCPTGHMQNFGKISGKTPKPKLSEFNLGLTSRGNIYRMYPQAVPATPVIDRSNCVQFLTGDCGVCAQSCSAGAIDYDQKEEVVPVQVGSVILAPGFQTFNPQGLDNLAYHHPNVVTTLEFERILSPGGPFQGHVQLLSDGREPKKIAWILCVGSRSEREGCHSYCSAVCCMTALKQAIIAKEHVGPDLQQTVFYMDMRTTRKDFEKYYDRAQGQGTRLIRAMVHSVEPKASSGDLSLEYVTEKGELRQETFDMVVLGVGMEISPSTKELAQKVGIDLGPHGFVEASCLTPVTTSRPGIYACGAFTGPKDIPESVREGSAAVASATKALAEVKNTWLRKKVYPPEKDVWSEPVRIGVFVCNCGINIGGVVDVPAIAEYARTLADVAYVQENLFTCSEDAQNQMIEMIREHSLNRVVVGACSPSTHQPIFQDMLRNAGLNKYLFEMANIRNHCTWVHQQTPEAATEKCQDLINMAVAKARLLEPLPYLSVAVNKKALVIGGGVASLSTTLALAGQGHEVHLVEKNNTMGGNALKIHTTWRGEPVGPFVSNLIHQVKHHDNINLHLESTVTGAQGSVGNFTSKLSNGRTIDHGIVVLATGAKAYQPPEGTYLYKEHPQVFLSLDLDREIVDGGERLKKAQAAAFIQCVGSRVPERPYCSRVCCTHSVETALKLKKINPDLDIFIIYRDLRTTGERELLYKQARDLGVYFFRYSLDNPPQVTATTDGIKITVTDHILNVPVSFTVDLLTLATAIVPRDNTQLAEMYKVALNEEGFFSEAHAKIRPVDCATEGIFLAGLCHNPKPIEDSIRLGLAAATRASGILSKNFLEIESTISCPIDENCDGCAFCVDTCPYKAITLLEYMKEGSLKKTVEINEIMCKGCGSCMATCPKQGIYVAGFTPEQLGAQVEAALGLA